MKALVLTDGQLESILFKESGRFEVIDEGGWEQDGKSQYCIFTFKDTTTNLLYEGFAGRSGSPFTDWTYGSEIYSERHTLKPVKEIEVVIVKMQEVDGSEITETETVKEM